MKFKALKIGSGDAFLIEKEGKQFLFDSGGAKATIKNLLRKNKVIDLAICSHNDSDHSNGFIGLLEDSKFDIKEIWLPGLWIPILKFIIDKKIKGELIDFFISRKDFDNEIANSDFTYENLVEKTDISIEEFDSELKHISELLDYRNKYFHYFLIHWYNNESFDLDRIVEIAGLAYKHGCLIRWFKPDDSPSINGVDYGFKPLNSKEIVKIDKVDQKNFLKLLYLTNENKFSLVFEYFHDNNPLILFTADSDLAFLSTKNYNSKSVIVTSPHHGSESNDCVYGKIIGNNIIWVRSDGKRRKNPCAKFKLLNNDKYCVACAFKNHRVEIEFDYCMKNNNWIFKNGQKCTCK